MAGPSERMQSTSEEKPEPKCGIEITAEEQCEYRDDIWKNLLEDEPQKPVFHLQSPQLEFRGTLVQQLRVACRSLHLHVSTLHAAVALLDLFMDAHLLRADRLTHVAMACLSLAAKSEEKFSHAPALKTLSAVSGVQLCGSTFRQLEWMVGQHARWRLLAPTAVTFASLIAHCVVSDEDLTNKNPKFVRRFRHDGAKLLEAYLDLTLSDVRIKVVDTVDVACACVACARADLGLCAWPPWLVALTTRKLANVSPIARLLQRMMQALKSRDVGACVPNMASLRLQTSAISRRRRMSQTEREEGRSQENSHPILDMSDRPLPPPVSTNCFKLPSASDVALQRVTTQAEYRFTLSNRLLESSYDPQASTSGTVKRGMEASSDQEAKRFHITAKTSQLCL